MSSEPPRYWREGAPLPESPRRRLQLEALQKQTGFTESSTKSNESSKDNLTPAQNPEDVSRAARTSKGTQIQLPLPSTEQNSTIPLSTLGKKPPTGPASQLPSTKQNLTISLSNLGKKPPTGPASQRSLSQQLDDAEAHLERRRRAGRRAAKKKQRSIAGQRAASRTNQPTRAARTQPLILTSDHFSGKVIISDRRTAEQRALNIYDDEEAAKHTLVMWCDGSYAIGTGGAGVVFRRDEQWIERCYSVQGRTDSYMSEVLALDEAFRLAAEECSRRKDTAFPVRHVQVLSDSMDALRMLVGANSIKPRFVPIATRMQAASFHPPLSQVTLEVYWVPGHVGVPGNVRADSAARGGRIARANRREGDP